jgi:hypothetical protein
MEDMNPSSRWLTPVAAVILSIPFGASLPAFAQSAAQAPAQPNASAAAPGSGAPTHAPQNFAGPVKIAMRNVDFHLTDRIVVHMVSVDGKLTPVKDFPVFDDKLSFALDVDSANVILSTAALTNDLNDYVFAASDAPLKKLEVTAQGNQLIVKGLLASKGDIPFESAGAVSVTPDGKIRVHTTKVKALKLEVKGLMDLIGLDTQKLIDTKKVPGVATDKDDLILDPEKILPQPEMRGHLTNIQIQNGAIALTFGHAPTPAGAGAAQKSTTIPTSCGGANYIQFRGNTIRFGKLTMTDADLELLDDSPADPFDFAMDHYLDQLVAGYIKPTKAGGMCAYMKDYNKVTHAPATKKRSAAAPQGSNSAAPTANQTSNPAPKN